MPASSRSLFEKWYILQKKRISQTRLRANHSPCFVTSELKNLRNFTRKSLLPAIRKPAKICNFMGMQMENRFPEILQWVSSDFCRETGKRPKDGEDLCVSSHILSHFPGYLSNFPRNPLKLAILLKNGLGSDICLGIPYQRLSILMVLLERQHDTLDSAIAASSRALFRP